MTFLQAFTVASLMATTSPVFAQQSNKDAIASRLAELTGGSIDYELSSSRSITINYEFAPLTPTTSVRFSLYTPEPSPVSFSITDSEGNVLKSYTPKASSDYHTGELPVSDLAPGQYFYVLTWEGKKITIIPFDKK